MQPNEHPITLRRWLAPLTPLYRMVVGIRNLLFDWKILSSKEYNIPIISVGNITVGGTGKTPHIEYLIELLSKEFNVAVLSRGYKRKSKGFQIAGEGDTAQTIGDEPYQMKRKYPHITVAVDANRCRGVEHLMQLSDPAIDVILLDDAYQHRHITPSYSILLTDFNRPIYQDKLLPWGNLREPKGNTSRANVVVVTKCPNNLKPMEFRLISKELDLYPYQRLYFSEFQYGRLMPLFPEVAPPCSLEELAEEQVLVVSGIANPRPFIEKVAHHSENPDVITYADHHNFTAQNLKQIEARAEGLRASSPRIIVTEKDAARLQHHPQLTETLKAQLYYLPLTIHFLQDNESFINKLENHVKSHRRNSRLYR